MYVYACAYDDEVVGSEKWERVRLEQWNKGSKGCVFLKSSGIRACSEQQQEIRLEKKKEFKTEHRDFFSSIIPYYLEVC